MNNSYFLQEVFPSSDGNALVIKTNVESEEIKLIVLNEFIEKINFKDKIKQSLALDKDEFSVLLIYAKYTKAILKGIYLLGYSQSTKKGISRKLIKCGFSKEESEYASQYLEKHGYINEKLQCELLFDTLVNKKLYGKSRVVKELYIKGFSKETINEVVLESETDYDDICEKRMRKQANKFPLDKKEKQKFISSFLYYGFTISNINNAYKNIMEEI